jgi:hypothetical protein
MRRVAIHASERALPSVDHAWAARRCTGVLVIFNVCRIVCVSCLSCVSQLRQPEANS